MLELLLELEELELVAELLSELLLLSEVALEELLSLLLLLEAED